MLKIFFRKLIKYFYFNVCDQVNDRPVYLVEDKIPVPGHLWKLVVDTRTGESILFLTVNNPFLQPHQYGTRSQDLCPDICDVTRCDRIRKYF